MEATRAEKKRYPDFKDIIDLIFRVRKLIPIKIACKYGGTAQYDPAGLRKNTLHQKVKKLRVFSPLNCPMNH